MDSRVEMLVRSECSLAANCGSELRGVRRLKCCRWSFANLDKGRRGLGTSVRSDDKWPVGVGFKWT